MNDDVVAAVKAYSDFVKEPVRLSSRADLIAWMRRGLALNQKSMLVCLESAVEEGSPRAFEMTQIIDAVRESAALGQIVLDAVEAAPHLFQEIRPAAIDEQFQHLIRTAVRNTEFDSESLEARTTRMVLAMLVGLHRTIIGDSEGLGTSRGDDTTPEGQNAD